MGLLIFAGLVGLVSWPHNVAADEVKHEGPRFSRRMQEEDAIGLDIVATPLCPSSVQCDEADYSKLVGALETDDQVTGECSNRTRTPCSMFISAETPYASKDLLWCSILLVSPLTRSDTTRLTSSEVALRGSI